MNISEKGIKNYYLSKEEFELLPYIDSRNYIESSKERFTGWESSFDTSHPDWKKRIEVQSSLMYCLDQCLAEEIDNYINQDSLKVIFLGASLGSIASYFSMNILKKYSLLDKTEIYIYDLLHEPLEKTKKGDFDFSTESEKDCGFSESFSAKEYKEKLKKAHILSGSITEIPENIGKFDIVIAPYIHHHLNIYDKKSASKDMVEITKKNGLILLGDLYFTYETFINWLEDHKEEFVGGKGTYALESFITIDEHIAMFEGTSVVNREMKDYFYIFGLKK
ncbi:class I SAM-dependent methyltransferase [Bacillus alkalicellulosilyticus]|uniref:class I SAM-dependent methyltransferase n=1 Tax=Alkalihalobacterium alkalicellulosilyticum TaxID=1912214 RepID=UPI0011168305|nr:class I SAM-dependent methyltransferase [Bacillus alkalicellulosilyticus]